jgi:putative zinc finger/helix-turn-helix YgiT family protein
MRCPSCKKEDTLQPWEGQQIIRGVEIQARGQRCSSCGETLYTGLEVDRQFDEVARAIVARGIRSGDEFKFVRKATGFRAADLAELLDVRAETISRWERGEAELPRAAVYALGQLLLAPDETRRALETLASAAHAS